MAQYPNKHGDANMLIKYFTSVLYNVLILDFLVSLKHCHKELNTEKGSDENRTDIFKLVI